MRLQTLKGNKSHRLVQPHPVKVQAMKWSNHRVEVIKGSTGGEAHVQLSDRPPVSTPRSKVAGSLHRHPCRAVHTQMGYAALVTRSLLPSGVDITLITRNSKVRTVRRRLEQNRFRHGIRCVQHSTRHEQHKYSCPSDLGQVEVGCG